MITKRSIVCMTLIIAVLMFPASALASKNNNNNQNSMENHSSSYSNFTQSIQVKFNNVIQTFKINKKDPYGEGNWNTNGGGNWNIKDWYESCFDTTPSTEESWEIWKKWYSY